MENTEQKSFMHKLTTFVYVAGLGYCWFEECQWSPFTQNVFNITCIAFNIVTCCFFGMITLSPYLTQSYLEQKRINDMLVYNVIMPFYYLSTMCLRYYKDEVKQLIYELVVRLPSLYNDPQVEAEMVKKAKYFFRLIAFSSWFVLGMIILDSLIRSLKNDETFTTIITVWPDIEDRSPVADAMRILVCIVWAMLVTQNIASVTMIICMMIYTSHQFKQLQSYFCGLVNIFAEDLSQLEKENKYEAALKIGFKRHSEIISYTRKLVKIYHVAYEGQIIVNVLLTTVIMLRLVNEGRSPTVVVSRILLEITILCTTGIYMATLGDISLEAEKLTTAIYMSGWENCYRSSSVRVRKLLAISMSQTQNPFTIYALGVLPMSFSSFVSIVKFSYSIFSVIV
nr:odorant receptor 20 [Achelura yunnanensis]